MYFTNVGGSEGKYISYNSGRYDGESKVWCYWCGKIGHIAREFKIQKEEEVNDTGKDNEQE